MNKIACIGIFHTHCNGISAFFQGANIQTHLESGGVIAGNLTVIDISFQFLFFSGVQIRDNQFRVKLAIRRRKSGIFNIDIKNRCIICEGMKIQAGFFHYIAVSQVSLDIVISGAAGKYIITGIGGMLPFIKHSGIMLRIQIRYMHPGKISNGILQIIVSVIYGNFTAVRYILA